MKTYLITLAFTFFSLFCSSIMLMGQEILLNGEDTLSYEKLPVFSNDIDAAPNLSPPQLVVASDGDFDRFIKISWTALEKGIFYKVYRKGLGDKDEPIAVSRGWKKSNWMFDHYEVVPGKKYLYHIVAARDSRQVSRPSMEDPGFARLTAPVAYAPDGKLYAEHGNLLNDSLSLTIANIDREAVRAGDSLTISYMLSNRAMSPFGRLQVMVFLSQDPLFSWDDTSTFLCDEWIEQVDTGEFVRKNARLKIPGKVSVGTKYLLLVISLDGEVYKSKVVACPIKILAKH